MVFYHGYSAGVWYVAESAEGTTPTSPSFLHLAHKSEVSVSDQAKPNAVTKSGSVDFAAHAKGVDNPVITITFNPSKASGKAFLKNYCSSDTSFTLLVMIDDTADTIFARLTGCKVKRITTKTSIYPDATPVECTAEIWAWGPILFTVAPGTPSYEAAPNTFCNWTDVTVKKNTSTITKWWDIAFTIDNQLERIPDNTGATAGIKRGPRTTSVQWSIPAEDVGSTELDENKNATAVDINVVIDSDDYALVDVAYSSVEVPHRITGVVGKMMSGNATSLSIS